MLLPAMIHCEYSGEVAFFVIHIPQRSKCQYEVIKIEKLVAPDFIIVIQIDVLDLPRMVAKCVSSLIALAVSTLES